MFGTAEARPERIIGRTRVGGGARVRRSTVIRRGFTLIETALATVIVGVGVLAIVSAQTAFHKQNSWSTHASTAMRLGNEIREMTLNLPRHDPVTGDSFWGPEANELWVGDYDDLDDFDGAGNGLIFSAEEGNGPINARREIIPNMAGWTQIVQVYNVDPFDITVVEADGSTNMIKVEVAVTYQGPMDVEPSEVTRVSWIAPG
ncbi:MAG: prepilin-type N-terminal cleavage/methylation domain-containing protein [Phycisphaerales bacterium]|nr:MAG: prepilin-type N-terminal cleavage/methylation domain-containing protein [Phycisphaerales bacterium]